MSEDEKKQIIEALKALEGIKKKLQVLHLPKVQKAECVPAPKKEIKCLFARHFFIVNAPPVKPCRLCPLSQNSRPSDQNKTFNVKAHQFNFQSTLDTYMEMPSAAPNLNSYQIVLYL